MITGPFDGKKKKSALQSNLLTANSTCFAEALLHNNECNIQETYSTILSASTLLLSFI